MQALPALTAAPPAPSDVSSGGASAASALAAYPTPQEETFRGCPPPGDGGDTQLNLLKNRIDADRWQPVALSDLLALTWPRAVERVRRADWPATAAATVARTEGRPVEIEGYILKVRHERPESPNCHDATQRDYHVWLAAAPSDSRAHAMIVELTPRVVAHPLAGARRPTSGTWPGSACASPAGSCWTRSTPSSSATRGARSGKSTPFWPSPSSAAGAGSTSPVASTPPHLRPPPWRPLRRMPRRRPRYRATRCGWR